MHHKRKKSKRSVKCTICTPHRCLGNSANRIKPKEKALRKALKKEKDKVSSAVPYLLLQLRK